ncbi:hypothetical protein BOX15_Mlig014069g1, partial [Macrostomum lignano]
LSSPSLLNTVAMSTKSSHSPAPGKKGGSDGGKADESLMATIMSLIKKYDRLLNERPLLTKAATSGTIFGLGDILSQLIAPKPGTGGQFSLRSTFAYSAFGFFISGPLIHAFYRQLDRALPKDSDQQFVALKRTLIDRLLLAPPYLLLLYYSVPLFEGRSLAFAHAKVKDSFLDVLKMNVKIWSLFQFININYVPQKYRVLFMCGLSLLWNIYVAIKRR